MPKHALLSASASHRWLNCPPSAKLCADIKDEASPYAKQGTDAHSLCEFKVLTAPMNTVPMLLSSLQKQKLTARIRRYWLNRDLIFLNGYLMDSVPVTV